MDDTSKAVLARIEQEYHTAMRQVREDMFAQEQPRWSDIGHLLTIIKRQALEQQAAFAPTVPTDGGTVIQ